MKLLIYYTQTTARLQYIARFIWTNKVNFTNDKLAFKEFDGAKINYSSQKIDTLALEIKPHELLFETNIQIQNIILEQDWNELPYFFKTSDNAAIPFDIFSASFYLLTRYEEYLNTYKDRYGRYEVSESLAYKHHFLRIPLIDLWIKELHKILAQIFDNYEIPSTQFSYTPTFDIDLAYQYQAKKWQLQGGGIAKDLLKGNFSDINNRIQVWRKKQKDPFDIYEELIAMTERFYPKFFILCAQNISAYDHNISPNNQLWQAQIRKIETSIANSIQIHPSWQSFHKIDTMNLEKMELEKIIDRPIIESRQHFLKWKLPQTFQELIAIGIQKDYSMGYGDLNGFRASTAKSFNWFDLTKNEATNLTIYPFCYMDATSIDNQKMNASQIEEELFYFKNLLERYQLPMITLMHNHHLAQNISCKKNRAIVFRFWNSIA